MTREFLENFDKKRLEIIKKLERKEISKIEFLNQNLSLFTGKDYIEPDLISNIDEGAFYYQYFNTMAKCSKMKSSNKSQQDRISEEFYEIKENILEKILKILDSSDYISYYVEAKSKKLKNNLVEIKLKIKEKIIFHTLRAKTRNYLKYTGNLEQKPRKSLIDNYINNRYY